MGGPGGHMWHPFDCPDVNSGQSLMDFFARSTEWLGKNPAALKIDGVNLSFRLRQNDNMSPPWEFVVDRGATTGKAGKLDLEGVTADNAHLRFINKQDPAKPHGMVGATNTLLKILNSALPSIMPELKDLGFLEDDGHGPYGKYFNTEFVLKKLNVKEYPFNFIALHGVRQFIKKTDRARGFKEVSVDRETLNKLRDKLHLHAIKNSPPFKVYTKIETRFKQKPNLEKAYTTPIRINTGLEVNTKTLRQRLIEVSKSPYGEKIVLKEEFAQKLGIPQTQDPFAKKIYLAVLNGALVPEMVANEDHIEPVVDAFVMQHAVRLVGNAILDASDSEDFGSARDQEGIVIGPTPEICGGTVFKYTGDFIVGGLASSFKSPSSPTEDSESEIIKEQAENSPIKKVIAIYPGRFQPAGRHHAAAWTWLQTMFGAEETYLATSGVVKLPKSPFTFHEKQEILKAHGIPDEKIVETRNPYRSDEITSQYDPDTTAVVFMVGEKDMKEDPRFKNVGGTLKSGKAAYYKDFKENKDNLEPLSKHGYLITAPHVSLNVPGHGEMSGTSLREYLKNASREQFSGVMGWYEEELFHMIQNKLKGEGSSEEEGELNENFLSMDSLYSLVDEALHEKYKNVLGLNEIVSLVDQAILEKKMTKGDKNRDTRLKKKMDPHKEEFIKGYTDKGKSRKEAEGIYFATIRKRAMAEHNNINETPEEELNTNIERWVASILPRLLPNLDAEKLGDLASDEGTKDNIKDEIMAIVNTAKEQAASPKDVAKQMAVAEVSGAGGGGLAGHAGNAWAKKKKKKKRIDGGGGTFGGGGASGTWEENKKRTQGLTK